jgi:hypothetical protein
MQILERPPCRYAVDFPEHVARFRRVLEETGATACDDDLAWAWGEHSERTWCASWVSPGELSDEMIAKAIRNHLRPRVG